MRLRAYVLPTMMLPHATRARVDRAKLLEYLLAPEHPENGGKAGWFAVLGYPPEAWAELAAEFRRLAKAAEVAREIQTTHGRKYIQDGFIRSYRPDASRKQGAEYGIRMVWIIETGEDAPRLVTAYPGEGLHT